MTKQTINRGSAANDGTGDNLRAGGAKINSNFDELYNVLGDGTTLLSGNYITDSSTSVLSNKNNISVNLAGKVAETSISSYAIANIATSIPQMNWNLSITNQYLIEDPVLEPLNIKDGKVFIKETIGLGTEIDMNKAKKYITQN